MKPLSEFLKDHLGDDLPVAGDGTCKRNDPLIITELRDYVGIEYAIASFLLSGREHQFEGQAVHQQGDRVIDELVYAASPNENGEWTETRRFFFDITAGHNARLKELESSDSPLASTAGGKSATDRGQAKAVLSPGGEGSFSVYALHGDASSRHLKFVEQKFELLGLILGPFWIAIKGGPISLVAFLLALIVIPIWVFGVSSITVTLAVVLWALNARSHSGIQAMRLASIGFKRVGDVRAHSPEEAEAIFRRSMA